MDLMEKLEVLTDAAKYDAACTSSGVTRRGVRGALGNAVASGICHSFSADGRCVSLLKVLLTNACAYDCKYCVNRSSNDVRRAAFTPQELAELTMGFYRRNYIEGLFLSSAVAGSPDKTCELMLEVLRLLRNTHHFFGYIHVKAIPGADARLTRQMGLLADRISVNIELPSEQSLNCLAPEKSRAGILFPMRQISSGILDTQNALSRYRYAPKFAPAGQSTQLIIGATPESDRQILTLSEALYRNYHLKRVFFSAYVPVVADKALPPLDTRPPLLREHRLYQADWLLRFYGFEASELFSPGDPGLDMALDPKCQWALGHMGDFPIEVNTAAYEQLLRVPGIGVKSAWRITVARREQCLTFDGLKRLGVVLKRAGYFLTAGGKALPGVKMDPRFIRPALIEKRAPQSYEQLSFLEPTREDVQKCLTGQI